MTIEFTDNLNWEQPKTNRNSKKEIDIIHTELSKLISKGVVQESEHEEGEIISPIFIKEKSVGTHRLILNLKKANEKIVNHHFKMETISTILQLIQPNCYMESIDIKDAYYTVAIRKDMQKYLKFQFEGKLFVFRVLLN